MNPMIRRAIRTVFASLALAAIAIAVAGPALASHVIVSTTAPAEVTVGEVLRIPIALRAADGGPLRGTSVTFYLHASFAGVTGEAEIGRAVTDESGVATLTYKPRLAGHHEIRIEYLAPGESEVEVATTAFDATGDVQLYRPAPGVSVPGLNVGLLMAVLTTVWTILFGIALRLVAIARAGREGSVPASGDAG